MAERANDGITIIQDTLLKYVNPRLAEIIGYTIKEIVNTPFANYIHPDELPKVVDRYKRRMAGEDIPPIYETTIMHRDGSEIDAEFNAGIIMYQGEPADLVFVRDITESKKAEEKLRLLSSSVEQSSEGIGIADMEGNILSVNNAFASMHGYASEELAGKHLSIFHTPEQMPAVKAANRQVRETGEFNGEIWHARRDGTVFPTLMHNSLLRNEAGNPIGIIGTLRDITEHKQAEDELRFRSEIITNMVGGVIVVRASDNVIVYTNPEFEEMFGYGPNEITGKDISINELALLVSNNKRKLKYLPHHHPQSEIAKLCCNYSKAQSLLGWKPRKSLKEGILKTEEWMKSQ